jgi:transcription-repair coupling factor (superfamily II helicase)
MTLRGLASLLAGEAAVAEALADGGVVAAPEPARAPLVAALAELARAPAHLVVVPSAAEAEQLAADLRVFLGPGAVELLPAWETLPFERVSPATETMGQRLRALSRLASATGQTPLVVVAPVRALLQRLAPGIEQVRPVVVRRGDVLDAEELVDRLVRLGYRREYQAEHRGEVARRGGIVDVVPSTADEGVRIDLFGDEVERLSAFDLADQRSVRELEEVEIPGARELVLDEKGRLLAAELARSAPFGRDRFERLAEGALFDGMESFLPWLAAEERVAPDLLPEGSRVVLVEPRRARARAQELEEEEAALAESLAATWGLGPGHAGEWPRLHLPYDRLLARARARTTSVVAPGEEARGAVPLPATGWPAVVGDLGRLAARLRELLAGGFRVVAAASGRGSAERIAGALVAEGLPASLLDADAPGASSVLARPGLHVVVEPLDRGVVLEGSHLALLGESDVTGRRRAHRVARPRPRPVEGFFDDLAPGSYVVHAVHGVARYAGMVTRSLGGVERDYLLLEYRGGDRLYVPSDQIGMLTPYSGGDSPSLSRMGGADWHRQTARVRAAVREVAEELVQLYRRRLVEPGHAFAPDTPWQAELEQSFPYVETPDQLRAVAEVKADMESPAPMDRLVCGDVGFGKTEVAVRAVFKAVQDGLQAAVLVPTTLLAQQHFQTFSERFAPFPVRVEVLSRFLSPAEARRVVSGLASGEVDVVIGTHRLLGADVRFKALGLLVVDEEQRFGVAHKEAIKQLRTGVDVLTLTASPIPRTLEMSLTGIRDLSLVNTPPSERQPILTYVGEHDERAVVEAVRRELLREGQVFYVHNRVQDIEHVAARLRELVPEARVAVAHGQMDEGSLEQVVLDFWERRYDVLVCTTIIESGIDMPTVNTLVVDRADLLGLGQLHQLRGRVGRSGRRAYAYLLYPPGRALPEQAEERLRTIGEHTDLGSGFKIAMRDLEIRGAGNLLGRDQSGHIAAVGYDLYVRMVAEAVAELKGEAVSAPVEATVDLPVDAYLPADYVAREDLRLEAYRRLAGASDPDEVDDVAEEWRDRFGPLPAPAVALVSVARLRTRAASLGVREVTGTPVRPGDPGPGRRGEVVVRCAPLRLRASQRVGLARRHPRALAKDDPAELVVPLPAGADLADRVRVLLEELCAPSPPAGAGPAGAGGEAEPVCGPAGAFDRGESERGVAGRGVGAGRSIARS